MEVPLYLFKYCCHTMQYTVNSSMRKTDNHTIDQQQKRSMFRGEVVWTSTYCKLEDTIHVYHYSMYKFTCIQLYIALKGQRYNCMHRYVP